MGFYRNNNGVIENLTPTAPPAIGIQYDNTSSGLEADNVQDAVDEVVDALDGKQDALTNPLTQNDVVNNLTSTDTNLPLSAAMGKSLKNNMDVVDILSQCTINPNNSFNVNTAYVYKIGHIVFVSIFGWSAKSLGAQQVLLTGLPACLTGVWNNSANGGGSQNEFFIDPGSSTMSSNIVEVTSIYVSLMYFTSS